jgi:cholera toxin transcriptional activator
MLGPSQRRLFRFGLYEADVTSGDLRKNGVKQKIQGQPFEVLVALLERPNQVITREELRARLWPRDTFVDFDHSLNTAINKVRDVLGDTAANPRFLETLPKRGYRFIAPVQTQEISGFESDAPETLKINAPDLIAAIAPAVQTPSPAPALTTDEQELPHVNRTLGRSLFALIQIMYLVFYVVALWKLEAGSVDCWWLLIGIILSAVVGIPMRLYLLAAAAFDYRKLGASFRRLWPAVLFFDLLWALAPFLLVRHLGFGLAFGACAALLYVPFSQRTLVRMTYQS